MKTKFKVLVAMLVAICIAGMSTVVNATTEFSDEGNNFIVTLDEDLGLSGTKVEVKSSINSSDLATDEPKVINVFGTVRMFEIDQDSLNEFITNKKTFKAKIKIKMPSGWPADDIDKFYASGVETTEASIEEIDGEKYFVYYEDLNCAHVDKGYHEVLRMGVTGGKVRKNIKATLKNGDSFTVVLVFYGINLHSENDMDYNESYGNINDIHYENRDSKTRAILIPSTIDLKDVYYKLYVEDYQGESIEIENFGTLNYIGIQETDFRNDSNFKDTKVVYVYANSLDNLQAYSGKTINFVAKNGYTISCSSYTVSSEVTEKKVSSAEMDSVYELGDDLTIMVSANGIFEARALELPSTDPLHKKLLDEFNKRVVIDEEKQEKKKQFVFNLYRYWGESSMLGFDMSIPETVTFTVGSEHDGEKYVLGRLIMGEYEHFEGEVADGKITITVNGLSSFMLTLIGEKEDDVPVTPNTPENPVTPEEPTTPENPVTPEEPASPEEPTTPEIPDTKVDDDEKTDTKVDENNKPTTDKKDELDDTPKTGSVKSVSNILYLSLVVVLITFAGVVVYKKEQ